MLVFAGSSNRPFVGRSAALSRSLELSPEPVSRMLCVKVVPCAQIGGESYIASLSRMYPHIPLIASGGVNQQNASKFILAGAMALGVGRELIPAEAIRHRQVDRIGELARRFVGFVKNGRDHLAARKARRMAIDE